MTSIMPIELPILVKDSESELEELGIDADIMIVDAVFELSYICSFSPCVGKFVGKTELNLCGETYIVNMPYDLVKEKYYESVNKYNAVHV